MNIVYLVFGNNLEHYQQIYFSIFTAMARKKENDRIVVIAEDPSLFNFFEESVEIIEINKEIIKRWEGQYQFFWRVKIKALQLIAEKYPSESVLYLDGDTFFYQDLITVREGMNNGQNFMHLEEGKLSSLSSKTEKLMWKQMQGKEYNHIKIDKNSTMWNAGLIGISKHHLDSLQIVLDVNDAMCADDVTRRLIEQFAFSLGLSKNTELKSADHIVGNYWGNKKHWNTIITNFLKESFMKKHDLLQIIENLKEMDLTQNPVWVKESNTERRLEKFLNKFYQNKKTTYIKK